ncbi:hypothetical protein AALB81_16280 [Lachnospiraceae bacterium 48-33]
MEEKIQGQSNTNINRGKQPVIRGVVSETDRLHKAMERTSGEKRKTGNIGLNELEKQKLIEQYIVQKNKNSSETKNPKKSSLAGSSALTLPEKALDKLSGGLDALEETIEKTPVIQEDNAENLATTEINQSVELLEKTEKLAGKIPEHVLKKKAIKEELKRGFEIGESLRQTGENGKTAREQIFQKNEKAVCKIERKAEKRNRSESKKLGKDLEKLERKYNQKIIQADSQKKADRLYEKKAKEQLKADKKHTKKLSKKTDKAAYKQVKKHGGVESAAMAAMVSQTAMDNRINKKTYKQEVIKNRKGISNGSHTSQSGDTLKIRAGNIGENNRHIHMTTNPSRRGERNTKILKKGEEKERTEKFIQKQEKAAGKKVGKLERKKQNRTRKIENRAMIRKAKMQFMVQTLLSDEKNSEKTAGIELMKQIFAIRSRSLVKRMAGKAGHMILVMLLGIVQFFISVLMSVLSLFITCLFPVVLVGVCVLTIYSAIAYIGGFFNTGGRGVLTVAETEINLMDRANDLFDDFSGQISSYQNQSRVVKNTETEYVEETYTITYPYSTKPEKGDFLTGYFSMISETQAGDLTNGNDILPYLNINTAVENNTLNQVFGQMNYFGTETYSETSRRELIGYEQKKVTKQVMTGYQSITESHSVPADSPIYDYGTAAGNGSIYLGVDMIESYEEYIQLPAELLSEKRMYCYLYTTSNNKIPLGCELSLDVSYKNSQNEDVPVTLKMQVVGIDTSGRNLYRNSPHIKLFNQTLTNLEGPELLQAYKVLVYRRTKGIDRFGNFKSLTAYTYETTRQVPVYETRERYVDDMEKPIYKTYIYKKYSKPVYYLSARVWYSRYSSFLSEKQKETYQECVELYHNKTY